MQLIPKEEIHSTKSRELYIELNQEKRTTLTPTLALFKGPQAIRKKSSKREGVAQA